jgi:hypothetical protein
MNYGHRWLVIVSLVEVGVVLAFVFLHWGGGASDYGSRMTILVLVHEKEYTLDGSGNYGLYTTVGVPGILLGLITPLCLFAAAAFVALATKARE